MLCQSTGFLSTFLHPSTNFLSTFLTQSARPASGFTQLRYNSNTTFTQPVYGTRMEIIWKLYGTYMETHTPRPSPNTLNVQLLTHHTPKHTPPHLPLRHNRLQRYKKNPTSTNQNINTQPITLIFTTNHPQTKKITKKLSSFQNNSYICNYYLKKIKV